MKSETIQKREQELLFKVVKKYLDDEISDKFLIEDYYDSELSYDENKKIIMQQIKLLANNTKKSNIELKKQEYNIDKHEHENKMFVRDTQNLNKNVLDITTILRTNSIIGVAGNRNTAKTSLVLNLIKDLRTKYKDLNIFVMGLNEELKPVLDDYNILTLNSKMDILDLNIKDSIIYIDEFALLFSTSNKNKQLDKLMRFFDRIEHLNNKLIISTAREGFYNKFMCSRINCFLTKQIEYEALVNGTWLKERIKAVFSNSDYRLECEQRDFYVVGCDLLTSKHTFEYNKEFDTKSKNKDLFKLP